MGAEHRPVWAEIDAQALIHNYRLLAALAAPARICAVVKADAYGHGAVDVARILHEVGCRDFAVAFVDEGVELRQAGIDGEILVLSEPAVSDFGVAGDADISLTLYSLEAIGIALATRFGKEGKRLSFQLKLDTGMYRAGASLSDLDRISELLEGVDLDGIWSHFAVADLDDPESVAFTKLQIEGFRDAVEALSLKGITARQLHIANTAGLLDFPQVRFSKVRVGLGLYGYDPNPKSRSIGLRPVLSLISKVTFIRQVEQGVRPSYGRLRPIDSDGFLGLVPIGYADGVPRALFRGGGKVAINGVLYPFAGMVSMDQSVIDLGPDPRVQTGDRVVLLGSDDPVSIWADEWALRTGTISWEILCGISKRVPRRVV